MDVTQTNWTKQTDQANIKMASEDILKRVRSVMMDLVPPRSYDKVYKDECMFTFDTPFSPGGLYINLKTYQAFGEEALKIDIGKVQNQLYLHEKWTKVPLEEEEVEKLSSAPERLAIGVTGGFQVDAEKHTIEKSSSLVVMPDMESIPLPCLELPEIVIQVIKAVQDHTGASVQNSISAWEEDENVLVSKYAANLEQLPATKKISSNPRDWKCDETGVQENLWLNLSTGFIGSGRQVGSRLDSPQLLVQSYFDSMGVSQQSHYLYNPRLSDCTFLHVCFVPKQFDGSGGNGSALRHYDATGRKYPLAVKLGTITPKGADVYSYALDEDSMVVDPELHSHLLHWGIDMMQMDKTEKTMTELQVEINMSFEFNKITEAGESLIPVHGPGVVGLKNLGNSCYMNSILQTIWMLPIVSDRYVANVSTIFDTAPADPSLDFHVQMAKLGVALTTCRTGNPHPLARADTVVEDESIDTDYWSVRPQFFKNMIGRNHEEFSSMRQQDASEFFLHLLDVMDKAEGAESLRLGRAVDEIIVASAGVLCAQFPTSHLFAFELEYRMHWMESNRVQYRREFYLMLTLNIPIEAAVNREEVESYKQRELKRQKLREEGADMEITQEYIENGVPKVSTITRDSEEEKVLPKVPFSSCLEMLTADAVLDDCDCPVLKRKTTVVKNAKIATFPPYLMIQLQRYTGYENGMSRKKEVLVELPDELDLEHLRAKGIQPGEIEQAEDAIVPGTGNSPPYANLVAQLLAMGMGFSENALTRAAIATGNGSPEAAMEWVLTHIGDEDINEPLPQGPPSSGVADDDLQSLIAMGFPENAAKAALVCNSNTESAADWLIENLDNLDEAVAKIDIPPAAGETSPGELTTRNDGKGCYELLGFVSHMGSSTYCGHYVCHLKKNDKWFIFNDEKVAISEKPPKDIGFMYLYRRKDFS